MADYWKSQPKKFCTYCKCWIADNKPSIEFHERGKNHKENVIKKISEIKKKSVAKAKEDEKKSKEFAAMEEAALKAYEEDLKRLEGKETVSLAPVGPSIEERRARDEQKRMELDAIEKHHAKRQWTKSVSPEGYPYFYNLLTGESQWEEPEGFKEKNEEKEGNKSAWVEGVSEEGYTYYYNSETGESRWDKPDDFDSNLPPGDEKKDSSDVTDVPAAKEQEVANTEVATDSTSEESQPSEDTPQTPTVTQTPKISFRTKKETKSDSDEVSDPESKLQEKAEEEKKDPTPQPVPTPTPQPVPTPTPQPTRKPAKSNPYGAWETVQEEEDPYENVDLELPHVEYDDPGISLPEVEQEPKVKFKEKTITSLGDSAAGVSVFKKRKLENVKSRNLRQRLNDQ